MKLVIQLLVVALVVNACAQTGMAMWRYFEFKDEVEQEARFGSSKTAALLHERIMKLAEEHEVPLDSTDLHVTFDGLETTISGAYYDYLELVPRMYTREHLFEFDVSVTPIRPLTPADIK